MISFQITGMEQQNLLGLITYNLLRQLLEICELSVVIAQIILHDLLLQISVVPLFCIFIEPGECPVPAVESHRSDAVTTLAEKFFCFAAGREIASRIQIRMPEVAQLHFFGRPQYPQNTLALHHVIFPILQFILIQRHVAVRVIAQLEARIEPHLKCFDPLIDFARLVQFFFIHEADHRNLLLTQGAQQFRRHRSDV